MSVTVFDVLLDWITNVYMRYLNLINLPMRLTVPMTYISNQMYNVENLYMVSVPLLSSNAIMSDINQTEQYPCTCIKGENWLKECKYILGCLPSNFMRLLQNLPQSQTYFLTDSDDRKVSLKPLYHNEEMEVKFQRNKKEAKHSFVQLTLIFPFGKRKKNNL